MQIFGIPGCDFSPALGVVQVPCPAPLPIAVAPRGPHPLPQLAVHRTSRPFSTSAKLILQIYALPSPRSRSRRASRSSTDTKLLFHRGSAPLPSSFHLATSWPNDIAKVDIDTPTKELAELAFQLEDKLRDDSPVDNSLQFRACRNRHSRFGNIGLAHTRSPLCENDISYSQDVNNTLSDTESANGTPTSAQQHQATLHVSDSPFGRLSGIADVAAAVVAAGEEAPLRLDHQLDHDQQSPLTLETPLLPESPESPWADLETPRDEQPPLPGTALSMPPGATSSPADAQPPAPRRSRNSLDNEARFSMVMEVLSSETLYVRRRNFDEDLWSFTSAGAVLHDQTTVSQICQEASVGNEPRRNWLVRSLEDRAFHRSRRRRHRPRDPSPHGSRELRNEAVHVSPVAEEDTERDTEEEAAKAIDRAEEVAKELEEAAEEAERSEARADSPESSDSATPRPSLDISGVAEPGHAQRPSVSETTIRPSSPSSSEESSETEAPAYEPEWRPIGLDRMGYAWWFLVDYACNLHWSFGYTDENGRQLFFPRREYERVQAMRRRTAALQRGNLSVVVEESES